MAGGWIRNFVDNFSDRIKIIGLADVLPDVLQEQGTALGLSENQLFSDFQRGVCDGQGGLLWRCDAPTVPQSCSDRCDGELECR